MPMYVNCHREVMRKVPKTRKNGKICNFRDFRDKTWNSAIYINFREKSRYRGISRKTGVHTHE